MSNWYRKYPGDYLRDTMHLTLEECGAYERLMDIYYSTGKPIPDDIDLIKRYFRESRQKTRKIMKVLGDFFEEKDGLLWHKKIEFELSKSLKIHETAVANGRAGGKATAIANAQANRVATKTKTIIPTSNNDVGTGKRKNFSPPLLDELKKYLSEKNIIIDPERFIDFYQSKNWMVGKNKMKDWKAAVRNWNRNNAGSKNETNKSNIGRKLSAVEQVERATRRSDNEEGYQ